MSVIGDFLTTGLGTIIKPITDVITAKQQRKAAKDQIQGQLHAAVQADQTAITVNDQHLEAVLAEANKESWKDEYATVSFISIVNFLMLGGILNGFGYPKFLEGTITGVTALAQVLESGGVFGFIMEATVLTAIGVSVWRRVV